MLELCHVEAFNVVIAQDTLQDTDAKALICMLYGCDVLRHMCRYDNRLRHSSVASDGLTQRHLLDLHQGTWLQDSTSSNHSIPSRLSQRKAHKHEGIDLRRAW